MINNPIDHYYSRGKLLLTGEYLVLDGALALAVPTRSGQSLRVERQEQSPPMLHWTSLTHNGETWFEGQFELPSGRYLAGTDQQVGQRLAQLLEAGKTLQTQLWETGAKYTYRVSTQLEFSRQWGLGSSSTLIANLAQWWRVDPYQLLALSFGGSGYDVACANAKGPVFYQLREKSPLVESAPFYPPFADRLYFLFLEQKQDSRAGIARYRSRQHAPDKEIVQRISRIGEAAARVTGLNAFQELLTLHEAIMAGIIQLQPVKERLFPDFPGAVKSLGAWGGDFVLVASEQSFAAVQSYFSTRGYATLIPYAEMVFTDK